MFCKHCGEEVEEDAAFCSKCGKDLSESSNKLTCPKCESEMEEAYFMLGEAYWSPEKGFLKGVSKRERIKAERQTQAWRCRSCRMILFNHA